MAAEANFDSKSSRWSLQGMTALVTGGSKGIGLPPLLLPYLFISFSVPPSSKFETPYSKYMLINMQTTTIN